MESIKKYEVFDMYEGYYLIGYCNTIQEIQRLAKDFYNDTDGECSVQYMEFNFKSMKYENAKVVKLQLTNEIKYSKMITEPITKHKKEEVITMEITTLSRINALSKHFLNEYEETEHGKITESEYEENCFECDRAEFLVLTDDEARQKAYEYIEDYIWSFKSEFIHKHSIFQGNDKENELKVIEAISRLYENGNEPMKCIIHNFESFVADAIEQYGQGCYIADYDFEEYEEDGFYIYRIS